MGKKYNSSLESPAPPHRQVHTKNAHKHTHKRDIESQQEKLVLENGETIPMNLTNTHGHQSFSCGIQLYSL